MNLTRPHAGQLYRDAHGRLFELLELKADSETWLCFDCSSLVDVWRPARLSSHSCPPDRSERAA